MSLEVIDAQGNKSAVTREGFVTVTGKAPVAHIMPPATFREATSHLPLVAPLASVQFSDASEGFPTQWNWSFTGASPAASTEQSPKVSYDFLHKQSVGLQVENKHGKSEDKMDVQVEYEAVINNLLPDDRPITYDLGNGTFPGSNQMGVTEYGERFSKPSRPMVAYGAYVYFVTNKASHIADQIANVGVHLRKSENGLPGEKLESAWWRTFELEVGGSLQRVVRHGEIPQRRQHRLHAEKGQMDTAHWLLPRWRRRPNQFLHLPDGGALRDYHVARWHR